MLFRETTVSLLQIKDFEHFRDPVSGKEYQKEIKRPMDLRKIHNKVDGAEEAGRDGEGRSEVEGERGDWRRGRQQGGEERGGKIMKGG